jgi:hypothetical protein
MRFHTQFCPRRGGGSERNRRGEDCFVTTLLSPRPSPMPSPALSEDSMTSDSSESSHIQSDDSRAPSLRPHTPPCSLSRRPTLRPIRMFTFDEPGPSRLAVPTTSTVAIVDPNCPECLPAPACPDTECTHVITQDCTDECVVVACDDPTHDVSSLADLQFCTGGESCPDQASLVCPIVCLNTNVY